MSTSSGRTARRRCAPSTVAQISEGQALIDSGLKPNETVVVDGQYRLEPGSLVEELHGKAAEKRRAAKRRRAGNSMNISAPFIRRPIATALLMVGLLLCGLAAYRLLPVAALPQRQLSDHPGHGAIARRRSGDHGVFGGDAARAAVRPDPGRDPDDLDRARSASPQITVQFDLSRDVDGAAQDVLAAINAASPYLPPACPTRRPSAR